MFKFLKIPNHLKSNQNKKTENIKKIISKDIFRNLTIEEEDLMKSVENDIREIKSINKNLFTISNKNLSCEEEYNINNLHKSCLLYTSPSPRD